MEKLEIHPRKIAFISPFIAMSIAACLMTSSCASFQPKEYGGLEQDFPGKKASIKDSYTRISSGAALFFFVSKVNGQSAKNGLKSSRQLTQGRGMSLVAVSNERTVVAGEKIMLTINATHETAAPIQSIFSSISGSTPADAAGDFEFIPADGENYLVNGENKNGQLYVWIESVKTMQRISPVFGKALIN
jgi:hypothetical protein